MSNIKQAIDSLRAEQTLLQGQIGLQQVRLEDVQKGIRILEGIACLGSPAASPATQSPAAPTVQRPVAAPVLPALAVKPRAPKAGSRLEAILRYLTSAPHSRFMGSSLIARAVKCDSNAVSRLVFDLRKLGYKIEAAMTERNSGRHDIPADATGFRLVL